MHKVSDWQTGRPWWIGAAVLVLLWTGGAYGINVALHPNHTGWAWLAGALTGGVLFGGIMAPFFHSQQRKFGGQDTSRDLAKVIKTGEVPDIAQPELWLPLMGRVQRSDRLMAWIVPVECDLFTALSVYLIATESGAWLRRVAAAVFVGLGIYMPLWTLRRKPKIMALITELETREPGTSSV